VVLSLVVLNLEVGGAAGGVDVDGAARFGNGIGDGAGFYVESGVSKAVNFAGFSLIPRNTR